MQTLLADVLCYFQDGRDSQEQAVEYGANCIDVALFVYLILIRMMELRNLRRVRDLIMLIDFA